MKKNCREVKLEKMKVPRYDGHPRHGGYTLEAREELVIRTCVLPRFHDGDDHEDEEGRTWRR